MPSRLQHLHFSTKTLPAAIRNDAAVALMEPVFELSPLQQGAELDIQVDMTIWAGMTLGQNHFNATRVKRGKRQTQMATRDQIGISLMVDGGVFGHSESTAGEIKKIEVKSGEILVSDLAYGYDLASPNGGHSQTLFLPKNALDSSLQTERLHGFVLHDQVTGARLFRHYLQGLHRETKQMPEEEFIAAQEMTVDILNSQFRSLISAMHSSPDEVLRQRIKTFIRQHLREQELGVQGLLDEFHVARATLYRLFAEHGGVVAYIRDQRLDGCYRDLLQADFELNLSSLLYSWGFSSDQQFLRAFTGRYGTTPSELRKKRKTANLHEDSTLAHEMLANLHQKKLSTV
ncbi:helix-turn-helix domain-containing protein [Lampropedia puyangensis]|uniref:Helix-turn-helix domain-containing protein n=1 Tax=Lampropedia puyangensis TaxID=1330072 RepID=A0A4S8EWL8_9BURK|nr:helix-turn-helix domain-containing protein [Lampropedia puyangensis]THT97973.1 helix-turn-helix domain-containing protein [Lampropedia puyangensis]